MSKREWERGLTFIEVVIILGIVTMLFGTATFNLIGVQNRTTFATTIDTLLSDIRVQQLKAMVGVKKDAISSGNFGLYFFANQYVLFRGDSYNENNSSNFSVKLPSNVEILSTTFTDNTVIFSALSGQIEDFSETGNTINLREKNLDKQAAIEFNKLGVMIEGN